jgi:predicted DNA-binding protein
MSRKKISTTIYVTPEQNDRLKLLHERTKVPVAVYIREGIDLVLGHYAHLLPGQLALDVTPPPQTGLANTQSSFPSMQVLTPDAKRRDEDEESAPIAPRDMSEAMIGTGTDSAAASGKP